MTDKLPDHLRRLFQPRNTLRYAPPSDHPPEKRHTPNISGVGQYLQALKEYKDPEGWVPTESWQQRKDRIKTEKKAKIDKLLTEGIKEYKPAEDSKITGDAFKTLFVTRLSYDTEPKDLEREFGRFGPIERIRIVENRNASPNDALKKRKRGYAFIVYEREKDMKAAYKETDGVRIKDRRVLVDVERGRTVSGWRPRRFGGGLGGRGYTKAAPARPSGASFAPSGPGFRGGGFGGGFRGGRGFSGDRGGGFRGGFGGRGGYGGGRGGIGYQSNGWSAPEGAPSGPRGGRSGYGGREDRFRDRGSSGANTEPLGSRGGAYRDRERDRDHDREGGYGRRDDSYAPRKRAYEDDSHGDPRQRRRY